jgi:hypothetical protein
MSRTRGALCSLITFPVVVQAYVAHDDMIPTYRMGLTKDRAFAPYQPGEVVWFCNNFRAKHEARLGKVLHVLFERDRDGFMRPIYQVQVANKPGNLWSGQWVRIYPGFIEEAYFADRGGVHIPRNLPLTLDYPRQLCMELSE